MSYKKGQRINPDEHLLTDKGEFSAIARDFGLMVAIDCWFSTHDVAALVIKPVIGLALGSAAVLAVTRAIGLL